MVVQLPDGALATAVGVQIYSYLCLLCSALMIALVCKHREKDSCECFLLFLIIFSPPFPPNLPSLKKKKRIVKR